MFLHIFFKFFCVLKIGLILVKASRPARIGPDLIGLADLIGFGLTDAKANPVFCFLEVKSYIIFNSLVDITRKDIFPIVDMLTWS